jgi:hypothetical protein
LTLIESKNLTFEPEELQLNCLAIVVMMIAMQRLSLVGEHYCQLLAEKQERE